MNRPIGFFDSGIGGATVLKAAMRLLPREDYVFFSDSANNPYGYKSDEEIMGFIHDNIESRRPYYSQAEIEFDTTLIETAAETEVTADRLITILQSYI